MTDPDDQQINRLESFVLTIIFTMVSGVLLALIGEATRVGQASGGWWTRPAFAPGLALGVLVVANLITLARDIFDLRANPASEREWEEARRKIFGWVRPLEFLAYYAVYIFAIQHLGYFPSTLVFVLWVLWRVGLRAPRWMLAGLGLSVFMIGVFRAGLGVWMPAPELYDQFPDALRLTLMRWF